MFEFLFKYPWQAFSRGELVFAGRWPVWLLVLAVLGAAAALAYPFWIRRDSAPKRLKPVAIWLLQTAMVAILLVLLWQPALSVATLRPQQNIVTVVMDDSRSMSLTDGGATKRLEEARKSLDTLLPELSKRFQVRMYRAGGQVDRIESPAALKGEASATRIGSSLKQVVSEAASLPIGAVVLMSDGADNSGGIDLDTTNEIRRFRIPIHTVGFGRERPGRDIEVTDVQMPQRVLAGARLDAQVTLRQYGYEGRRARITLKDAGKMLAQREVVLKGDGVQQTESLVFQTGTAGVRTVSASVDLLDGEENRENNAQTRLVNVDGTKPRVLYIEGEPRWEFKFIRRAIDADDGLFLVSILRTTQNKIYRQGTRDAKELEQGFPATVDELFGYQGIIIGGIEAAAFTPTQLELLRQFVDRRGGGVLWLGARAGLADGGWGASSVNDLLPAVLPTRKNTFQRDPAQPELTAAGRDTLICRLDDDPQRNADRWKKLPYVIGWQDAGTPKPGAVVLAEMTPQGGRGKLPLLITQNYGRGRTAIFATGGSWRWQMQQPLEDMSHEMFWQQMLRWLVTGATGPVISRTPRSVYPDEQVVPLRAEVRDRNYIPVSDAHVEAHVMGPDGSSEIVQLQPDPVTTGLYAADWGAIKPGSYVVETVARRGEEEAGRDMMSFRREDGVAENFGTQQNRELLEKLAMGTGGHYWRPGEVKKLSSDIAYSEAGISVRETRDLWNAPIFFVAALLLRSAEWLLRRKWGVV